MAETVSFPNNFPVNTLTHLCSNDLYFCAYCRLENRKLLKINVFHFGPQNCENLKLSEETTKLVG